MNHVDIYRAIADRTRRAILDELVDRSGQSLFELCARLIMKHGISSSRQAISQHLDILEAAGLIRTKREGRSKLHWFVGAPLEAIGERWPTSTDEDTSHSTDKNIEK
ncbi:MAG: helix-turn-helix transcriptional regulator [Gemmatimonadetes bacterium]|nr:helix-turn-helix transcriptional regulator [Gemmatimonadota bacterium]MYA64141.1 helix-turn-helix transcriptional regulator [Gemmatimonadota bacterium]MYB98157.1 helix-turn-helix transcriptional regulator [Gemmatimonadota bacterium]MYH52724.1 helix-turn-helix transcriptional regulator [Gemmatimonadota bacterium]MYI44944.1 helix-turn-helix transcriptional regulator [Gemmatimonadota bacterium]